LRFSTSDNLKIKQIRMDVGRFKTSLLEAGREGATPLFLIHDGALGGCARTCWEGLIRELHADFHIFAPDLYGFGDSDMVFHFGRRPYESHVEQVAALVEAIGVGKAHFVGASYGGSVLLRAAAATPLAWPMKSGTSISGTGGVFRHESGKRKLAETTPTRESVRECLRLLVDEAWTGFDENAEQRFEYARRPGHWEALYSPRLRSPVATSRSTSPDPYPQSLSACTVPILLVEGASDVLLERGWAARIALHNTAFQSIRLDTGHSPNLDRPTLVADVVRRFVAEQEAKLAAAVARSNAGNDSPAPMQLEGLE
jgi:pimeloyl-ACP methyl ester carboxylesterase